MIEKIIKNRFNREIVLYCWQVEKPQAVLVLAHGASEHIHRYAKFAQYLKEQGIMVIGYNHLGHAENKIELKEGVFFAQENGHQLLVSDLEDVCLFAYQQYTDLPLIVMGHSMGSLIVRNWAIKSKLLVDGLIICGSLHPSPTLIKSGLLFAKAQIKLFGKYHLSNILNKIAFGSLEKRISYNQENVINYKNDPECGQQFSNQAIYDLMQLMNDIIDDNKIKQSLKTKYFIISGSDDPFSNKTKQLDLYLNSLKRYGFNYSYKFYQNMKHEILNEENKEIVFEDIVAFIRKIK
ncbi:alpha/beta hydrolase [Erysipelotrichaceae bacterium OttesenSCG-928-M19]|nr:alpha/beta hydrolase [Erysipelotrichaceae bacterium OttesenSCG-928-M19]